MPPIPSEYSQLAKDFTKWVTDIAVWQTAIEAILREKLNLTEQEWSAALAQAKREVGIPVYPESNPDTIASLLRTVKARP